MADSQVPGINHIRARAWACYLHPGQAGTVVERARERLGLLAHLLESFNLAGRDLRHPDLQESVQLQREVGALAEVINSVHCRLENVPAARGRPWARAFSPAW